MGSVRNRPYSQNDEHAHPVILTQGFWMHETEITQSQWQPLMNSNPSSYKGADKPVENVTMGECREFCRRLSEKLGAEVQLPTEAQWEYACRADEPQQTIRDRMNEFAWHKGNSHGQKRPVRQKKPNAWGLYDMRGNVEERCSDWLAPYPPGDEETVKDPQGPETGGKRVVRGGSWHSSVTDCRVTRRIGMKEDERNSHVGLRVVVK